MKEASGRSQGVRNFRIPLFFVKEKYGFTVKFYRHCGEKWGQVDSQVVSEKEPDKQPNKQPDIKKSDEIAKRAEEVFEILREAPKASRGDIALKLNITETQVRTAIDYLKKENRIHHEGPAFGGSWVVN